MPCSSSTVASAKMLRMSSSTISARLPSSDAVRRVQAPRGTRARPPACSPRCGAGRGTTWSSSRSVVCASRSANVPSLLLPARQQLRLRRRTPPAASASPAGAASTSSTSCGSRSLRARRRPPGSRPGWLAAASSPRRRDQATSIGTSAAPRRSTDFLARLAVRHQQQHLPRRARDERLAAARSRDPPGRVDASGLAMKPIAPESSARSRASSVETTHTGMWRVDRSSLRRSSTRQPCMSGRKMSSVIAAGLVLAHHGERRGAGRADHALEALLARRLEQDLGEAQVVLDDQQHLVARLDVVAVVGGLVGELQAGRLLRRDASRPRGGRRAAGFVRGPARRAARGCARPATKVCGR